MVIGVFTTKIDSEQGKVTVSGIVDPSLLIKKLAKAGKHAEIWGSQQKPNLNNQLKNLQIDSKNNSKGQKCHNNTGNKNPPPKGSGQQQIPITQNQLSQMKGFPDLKLPQFKDLKMLGGFKDPIQNPDQQKAVRFSLPPEEDDLMSGDEFDDEFDDGDDYYDFDNDDEFEDETGDFYNHHPSGGNGEKMMMKPVMGSNGGMGGGANGPNVMLNALVNGGGGGNNGKKGGGGAALPVHFGGGDSKNGSTNRANKGNNQNQGGGGGAGKNSGKNGGGGGGMAAPNAKNVQNGGSGQNHGKKGGGGGLHCMDKGFQGHGGDLGGGGGIPIGHMGAMPAVQGLPAGGQGCFQGSGGGLTGPNAAIPGGNQYLQQQYLEAMMNQRAAAIGNGGDWGGGDPRFQPMMYAPPAPAVNYMPSYPYRYPYPPPHSDPYTPVFSDENTTSSCSIM